MRKKASPPQENQEVEELNWECETSLLVTVPTSTNAFVDEALMMMSRTRC